MDDAPRILATGLRFPEGPVWMRDGSVVLVEIAARHRHPRAPDGTVPVDRAHRRRAERAGGRAGRRALCLQQRRLRLADEADGLLRPAMQAPDYTGGCDPAHRPEDRRGPRALRPLRRAQAARAERHRVRRPWRLLLHRSRQDPRARPRQRRRLLRAAGRLADRRGRLSGADAERHRPVAGRDARSMSPRPRPRGSGPSISPRPARCEASRSRRRMAGGWSAACGGFQRFDSLAVDGVGQHLRRDTGHRLHHA